MREHEQIMIFSYGTTVYNPIMQERCDSGKERAKYKYKFKRSGDDAYLKGTLGKRVKEKYNECLRYPSSIQKFNTEVGLHPTQKPVALCEYLIKTYTNEGMIVLDNCMGSASTGIACLNTNRKFIGIEKDEAYFNVAKQRMESHQTPNIGE